MKLNKTKILVTVALFAALSCVATMVIRVPSPMGGYLNVGDGIVLLSAFLMGPLAGAVAGGIGSMLADLFAGYVIYAPGTLIIKAIVALVGGLIYRRLNRTHPAGKTVLFPALIAGVCGEFFMVLGYYLYAIVLYGSPASALADIPGNLIQSIFGILISTLFILVLSRIPYIRELFKLEEKK